MVSGSQYRRPAMKFALLAMVAYCVMPAIPGEIAPASADSLAAPQAPSLTGATAAHSKAQAPHRPKVCIGYSPVIPYSPEYLWGNPARVPVCQASEAMYTAAPAAVDSGLPPEQVRFTPGCCPLPADDILTDEQRVAPSECPENFVAVGLLPQATESRSAGNPLHDPALSWSLQCKRINTERYQLSAATPGAYWGFGATYWWQSTHYARTDIPPAVRPGAGRTGEFGWQPSGCMGEPVGALLVGKTSKRCHGLSFRQLQFRGLKGDPPAGTPVEMFPACRDVTDLYDPNAGCVTE